MKQYDYLIVGGGMAADAAGLDVNNGIAVDARLRTSNKDIYAVGDVANFYNRVLDRRLRVEHEDNAVIMGRVAGTNMAGGAEDYEHLPFFYSDLFEVGYEAVGELGQSDQRIGVWNGLYEQNIWVYLQEGRVRGVLWWNLFSQAEA